MTWFMTDQPKVSEIEILLAKLRALRNILGQRTKDPKARYFDPQIVTEYFERLAQLQDRLRQLLPDAIDDLPRRPLPPPSGTTDFQGRGYVERWHLERAIEDLELIFEVAASIAPTAVPPPSMPLSSERRFMELAVTEAGKSISEAGRSSPKVAAVIARAGVLIATAYRGELRSGEHAEYTALEKKCHNIPLARSNRLHDSGTMHRQKSSEGPVRRTIDCSEG
jgi:hypothetical protein